MTRTGFGPGHLRPARSVKGRARYLTRSPWFRPRLEWLEDRITPDAGPRVLSHTPTQVINAAFDHIDVRFNMAIDPATFDTQDVSILGPSGAVAPTGVSAVSADTFRVAFAPLSERGTYRATIGPDIRDLSGRLMDQNGNNVAGEPADVYTATFVYASADVVFTTPQTISENNTTYDGLNILINGTTLTIDGPHDFNSVHIINGGLTHTENSATQTHKLDLTVAQQVIVDATSAIYVSGLGYLPGRTTGNSTAGGATGGQGGSHGGRGGGPGPSVYGDYRDPDDWGAGGDTGAGGGLVRVAAGTLQLDGVIAADGTPTDFGSFRGAGAGGGVWVSADTIRGGGSIEADGGQAILSVDGRGGGGGRVAVYYRANAGFNLAKVTAAGGNANRPGGAGSVFIVQGIPHTHVRAHQPAGVDIGFVDHGNGFIDHPIDSITLKTNNPLDLSTFTPATFEITGQMGRVTPTGITLVGDRTYRIGLPFALTENGPYHFRLLPTIKDTDGFFLDQDADSIPGEPLDDVYSFDLTVDTVAPRITQQTPAGDLAGTISSVDVWFSEPIDTTTFTTSDIIVTRPDSQAAAVTGLTEVGLNRFRITFAPQTLLGTYHVRIGPDVRDLAGNQLDQDRDGTFGEPVQDVYDAAFNLVPVDLGLNSLVVGLSTLTAGEPVTVSWQGVNRTGTLLLGNWTDAVYISTDDRWDINDVQLTTVLHTGGLAVGQTYTGSATVFVPGKLPGNYRILVRADVTNQERETDETNNVIASGSLPLTVRSLPTTGAAVNGALIPGDRADYFAVHVNGGDSIALTLTGHASSGANELYVSLGSVPTRTNYDFRAAKDERFLNRQNESLAFTAPPGGGTYYLLAYGAEVNGSTPYDMSATTGSLVVNGLTPRRQGNAQAAVVTLEGAGFDLGTTVQFVGSDHTVRVPKATHLILPTQLTLDLDLPTWTTQTYTVHVTKGTATIPLPDTFEVIAGGKADLQTRLVLPNSLVTRGKQTLWLEYTNAGDAPMAAPLLRVVGDHTAMITADPDLADLANQTTSNLAWPPKGITSKVEVLGMGSGATPGILQPGDSGRIPIYYVGVKDGFGGFQLAVGFTQSAVTQEAISSVASSRTPIYDSRGQLIGWKIVTTVVDHSVPWSGGGGSTGPSLQDQLRPESIPADAWNAIWQNLAQQIGTDYANYSIALARDATHLHQVGQDVSDVSSLWGFEIGMANAALNPLPALAGAIDASMPTPGLSLSFSRVFGQSILSRYKLGSLGRGWSTNWDIRAETESNNDVVLRGPGGADRFFTLDLGVYRGVPGEHGVLTSSNGAFRLTETDQTIWQFRTDGKLDFVQDTNGNRITLAYNGAGQLTSLTHSSGAQILIDYNVSGRIWHVVNPLGPGTADDRVTTFEYDTSGQDLIRVTAPGNRITAYSYDHGHGAPREHALLTVAYPDGTHDFFAYDSRGRLTETAGDNAAQRVTYSYDGAGNVTVTDATAHQTFLGYGLGGHVAQVRDGAGRVVNLGIDSRFLLNQLVGPSGEKYGYSYDAQGNLIGVRDPNHQATTFSYDPSFNQLAGLTDARGNGIGYTYDTHGNLASITYADGTHEDYTYDARGNVLTAKNRRGQTLTYTYNAAGQVLTKDDSTTAGVDFVYTYNVAGNLTSAKDSSGTTSMTYDPLTDRLTRMDYSGGKFFTFEYDAVGRRTKRTDQDGHVENSFYDAAGRLQRMTDEHAALIVLYEYDPAGRLAKKTLGNGVYTTYLYDAAGNVLHLVNFKSDNSVLSRFDYTYDASGLRTSMATLNDVQTYGYDPLGQLTSVTYSSGRVVQYVFDAAGNRVKVLDNGVETTYTSNNLNQYVTVGNATYAYDLDGNLISKTEGGVTTTYTYNAENRLVAVTAPTDTWTYAYDSLGHRTAATHNGQTTNYVIDPAGLGNVAAEYDGNGNLVTRYDYGFGLVSRVDGAGQPAFYTFSAIGNTSEMTGSGGTVQNAYSYDPFGIPLSKTEAVANSFEFVGEYGVMADGNGMVSMRLRDYDVALGGFIEDDPIGIAGGKNLRTYASNNPVRQIDPQGLDSFTIVDGGTTKTPLRIEPWLPAPGDQGPWIGPAQDGTLTPDEFREIWNYNNELAKRQHSAFGGMGEGGESGPSGIGDGAAAIASLGASVGAIFVPYKQYHKEPGNKGSGESNGHDGGGAGHGDGYGGGHDGPGGGDGGSQTYILYIFISHDPNDKLGPIGSGEKAFIASESALNYQVRFENDTAALAPAQRIVVTDTLDSNLDLSSFQLTEIDFADQTIRVPAGLDRYETTVPIMADGVGIQVQVLAALDRDTRQLTLTLTALDPATGWLPDSPLVGLLYPNDATGRGEGSISYSVKPKVGLPSGTVIENRAHIVFDYNDPIDTPLVHNALDTAAPTSHVLALPPPTTNPTFTVQWAGADEISGSGLAGFDLYLSIDGGPYALMVDNTTDTSITLTGDPGHTYAFYTTAIDNVGHIEAAPLIADAQITILPTQASTAVVLNSDHAAGSVYGQAVMFTATVSTTASGAGTPTGSVQFRVDSTDFGSTVPLSGGVATLTTAALPAGSHAVTAVYTSNSPAFGNNSTPSPLSQAVAKAPLTVTAVNASKVYGLANPAFTAGYSGFVNGEGPGALGGSLTFSTSATAASHVSSYPVTPAGLTSTNYAITFVAGTLTVTPAALTVTADDKTKLYGQANPALTASYSGFVNGDTPASLTTPPTLSTTATAASHVGTYPVTASGAAGSDYTIGYVAGGLTVTPAALTVTADDKAKAYGAALPAFTVTYSGFVLGETPAVLGGKLGITTTATAASHVGGYAITPGGLTSSDYTIAFAPGTLTVTPVGLTITADDKTKPYGAAVPPLTASYSGFVNGDTAAGLTTAPTLSTTATAASHVAGYVISVGGAVDPDYTITYAAGTLTVTPVALTITADNKPKVYGAPLPALTASYVGFVNGDTAASLTAPPILATTATAASHVGAYPITAGAASSPDYTIAYAGGTLTVTPALLTVTADDRTRLYGQANPALTYTLTGFANGDTSAVVTGTATLSTTATAASPVGTYPITVGLGILSAADYAFAAVNGTLTVNRAHLTVSADNKTRVFGDVNPALTYILSGFANGETAATAGVTGSPSLTTTAATTSPVGAYAVTAGAGTLAAANYDFTPANGTLTVTPAPLTARADDQTRPYGAANPSLTGMLTGVKNNDPISATFSTPATSASPVGTYAIIPSLSDPSGRLGNYTVSLVNGTLTVAKAHLTVRADDQTKVVGAPLPALTYTLTGFANGETLATSGVTGSAALSTTSTVASPAGAYPITVTQGTLAAANYDFVGFLPGTLTVTAVGQPPTANAGGPYTVVRGGTAVLDASGSSAPGQPNTALTYAWDFNGDGVYDDATGMRPAFSAAGLDAIGARAVGLRVTDGGGRSATAAATVNVAAAALLPDPCDPSKTALFAGGTSGKDVILFQKGAKAGEVKVTVNGTAYGPYTPTGHVVAFGQGGDDDLSAGNVPLNAWLYGDGGNDMLTGGPGDDILLGGDGADAVAGNAGRDVLIAGAGADMVTGGLGDDLLINGTTRFDADPAALCAIEDEWTSSRGFAVRVKNLRGESNAAFADRLNGNVFLVAGLGATVFADGARDDLKGQDGNCWFLADVDAGAAQDSYDFGGADVVEDVDPPGATHTGPVAAYNFDANSGTTLADVTGRGHDGAIFGATWSATGGKSGGALSFDGANDWVTIADAADLDLTTGMTLEAWVRPAAVDGWRTVLLKESVGPPAGLAYGLYANGADTNRPGAFANTGGGDQSARGTARLAANAWAHLAATYDGVTLRLYVNGAEVGSKPVTQALRQTGNPLRIGGNAVWGEYFQGLIDDVRVYDRALSAAEVTRDMVTPVGPGADGAKFFVTDPAAQAAFRYGTVGAAAGGFALAGAAADPRGVAANAAGDALWVLDGAARRVVVQSPGGAVRGSWAAGGLQDPQDVTTDGTDVWVADAGLRQVLRYVGAAALSAGNATPAGAFALHPDNAHPTGLVTDGQTLWVTDDGRDEVFVYAAAGTLLGRWALDPANADASGVTRDPTGASNDLWVVDRVDARVYRYTGAAAVRSGTLTAADSFALSAADAHPEGIADPPTAASDIGSACGAPTESVWTVAMTAVPQALDTPAPVSTTAARLGPSDVGRALATPKAVPAWLSGDAGMAARPSGASRGVFLTGSGLEWQGGDSGPWPHRPVAVTSASADSGFAARPGDMPTANQQEWDGGDPPSARAAHDGTGLAPDEAVDARVGWAGRDRYLALLVGGVRGDSVWGALIAPDTDPDGGVPSSA